MKIYFDLPLKKKITGKKSIVIKIKFNAKNPTKFNICRLSCDHDKLQPHKFHGKPVRIKLLKKSDIENKMLIKMMEDILNSMKLPIKIIGIEKNNDKNKGININANGIKSLNAGSNVREYEIQYSPKRKKPNP